MENFDYYTFAEDMSWVAAHVFTDDHYGTAITEKELASREILLAEYMPAIKIAKATIKSNFSNFDKLPIKEKINFAANLMVDIYNKSNKEDEQEQKSLQALLTAKNNKCVVRKNKPKYEPLWDIKPEYDAEYDAMTWVVYYMLYEEHLGSALKLPKAEERRALLDEYSEAIKLTKINIRNCIKGFNKLPLSVQMDYGKNLLEATKARLDEQKKEEGIKLK